LREFGAANPDYRPDMLLAEAQLLLQLDRPEDSLALLAAAVEESPEDRGLEDAHAQVYVIVAQAATARNDPEAATALLEQGLAAYPDNAALRYARVLQWQREGRMRRAVTELESLVADNPDNSTLLNALGYLLTDELGRHEEARNYIQRALALEPDSAAIIDSMGWVLYHLGDLRAAHDYLERAYRLEADPEIAAHLVQTRLDLDQREAALQLLEQSLAANPESPHLLELKRRLMR
jgi:Flp pilus assembly protein TadD